ncbi:MAG TPA: Type 1 glutamine amidotransferase-like domain-containing protein, partial [Myxococcota bacterium]|nr:Type 1 glutamine amidotransferase-like domain-containing protein [Myxococcota bacterium]
MWLLLALGCVRSTVGFDGVGAPGEPSVEPDPAGGDQPAGGEQPAARPRWMLHGGGPEDDVIFGAFVEAAGFGRVVTLGALTDPADPDLTWWDGYFLSLGAATAATVNTFDAGDLDDADLAATVAGADAIFVRGGDQARYVRWWGHAIGDAIVEAFDGGAILGGSSAGCAILGELVYDAVEGSAAPYDVLLDPYDPALTFTPGLAAGVPGVLTDTHFTERGRLVRLAGMLARGQADEGVARLGVGVDPETALFL